MTKSLQLPDLLSICGVFELRTNRHCRGVSQASEKWLLECGITLSSMAWSAAKPGLLAAACHPSADATQLRFISDFLGLLLHHRERTPIDTSMLTLLSDRLSRAAYGHPGWYIRFATSQRRFLEARQQLLTQGIVPDLESYIEHSRDASGFRMALDMVQYAGDVRLPDTLVGDAMYGRLCDHACDVVAWSVDIVSCVKRRDEASIVTVLMKERRVPLECAVSAAGSLVKQSVDAFVASEEAILSVAEFAGDGEVRRYLRGLREWMGGFVNWLYETELFLGDKGDEVRTFGWVFIE